MDLRPDGDGYEHPAGIDVGFVQFVCHGWAFIGANMLAIDNIVDAQALVAPTCYGKAIRGLDGKAIDVYQVGLRWS